MLKDFWSARLYLVGAALGKALATIIELTNRVLSRLRDPEFSVEDIKAFINDAQNELLGSSPYMFLEKIYGVEDAAASGELEVPEDYQVSRRFTATRDNVGHTLEYVEPRRFIEDEAERLQDLNFKYTIFSGNILYHLPTSAANGEQLTYSIKLAYLSKPTQMVNDDDVAAVPDEFSEILVLGAMMRCEELRDNYDFARVQEQRYLQLAENLNMRYGVRQEDGGNVATLPYGRKITIYG